MTGKIVLMMSLFVFVAGSCRQKEYGTVAKQVEKLEVMREQALKLQESLQRKSGDHYLDTRDRYYELMKKRAETAGEYLRTMTPDDLERDELKQCIEIANIAHDELSIIRIAKTLFNRYPESKTDRSLVQLYFSHAYLIEPGEVETYVDISMFPPDERLYCYFMLALGLAESRALREAKTYYETAVSLLNSIKADNTLKEKIPLVYIAGLRTFILYRIGDMEEAYRIIIEARNEFPDESTRKQLDVYERRLRVLGSKAPVLDSDHVIGRGMPPHLSEQKGKVILLNFFTWDCQTCTTNLPFLFRLQGNIKNENFIMVGVTRYVGSYEHETGVSENREYEYMRDHYYKKRGLTWPVSISPTCMYDFGIDSVPNYILIDKAGIIDDGYYTSGNFSYLERAIRTLLAE
jgi:tetratricopeptide (TPR) repeat protein